MKKGLPSWVSLLYIPGDAEDVLLRASRTSAHAVILDLEDFVPDARKAFAREKLRENVLALNGAGFAVIVRINRRLDLAVHDIEAALIQEVDAIMVTKAANAEHLRLLDELVLQLEHERGLKPGGMKFIAMVETVDAVRYIDQIASSVERLVAMNVGAEDLSKELSVPADSAILARIKEKMILSACAAGVLPMGHMGSVKAFGDAERFLAMLRESRKLGFQAATCLTAAQADAINIAYRSAEADSSAVPMTTNTL